MKGSQFLAGSLLALLLLQSGGCVSLSPAEKDTLKDIRAAGLDDTKIQEKSAVAAGILNILPGFGNFYLAIGTDEPAQALYGVLNLLFWPPSVIWAIPQAAIDANTINKKATVDYYVRDPQGRAELASAKTAAANKPPADK
jgi:hypothetical protein